ncbi:nucleic acid/nucleotide deaminase domain-containing protein, partial [Streptomyces sp. PA03-6a]|nr:nucleic acid/nucleotide deaminase domain-containing protein [Streptomyces sp. PA03-6a]
TGGGGGGGSHFQSDGDSFDRIDTQLDGITGSLHGKSKGHLGRARNAKSRTGGRGEIAEHVMPIATKIVDGIGEAAEKAVGHLRGDMRKGLKQMHQNHRDNDDHIATELNTIHGARNRDPNNPTPVYLLHDDGRVQRVHPNASTSDVHPLDTSGIHNITGGKSSTTPIKKGDYPLPPKKKGDIRTKVDSRQIPEGGSELARATQLARQAHNGTGDYGDNNYAAVRYKDDRGGEFILVGRSNRAIYAHSERVLGVPIMNTGNRDHITELYTERAPCERRSPVCAAWLQHYFPNASVEHTFQYGPTKASEDAGNEEHQRYMERLKQRHGRA